MSSSVKYKYDKKRLCRSQFDLNDELRSISILVCDKPSIRFGLGMKFSLLPFPRVHVVSASEESAPECIMSFCSDVTAIVVAAERAYRLITPSESYDISNC